MKIKLLDGNELDLILVTGSNKYIQGQNRDALSFISSSIRDLSRQWVTY